MQPAALCAALGFACAPVFAQAYDLQTDWSDAANPNGAWSYDEGDNHLPSAANWQSGSWSSPQNGWARDVVAPAPFVPFCFRSNGTETFGHDWLAGDIVVHTTDAGNGAGNGPASFTWTSPFDGWIDVSGAVWMGREIGRSNTWTLLRNTTSLTGGQIASGDIYSRSSPFDLAAGSAGSAVLHHLVVAKGDRLRLRLVRSSTSGDFVGARLHIVTCIGIAQQPLPRIACPGTDIALSVTPAGTGPFTYRWRKGGVPIDNGGNVSGAFTFSLAFTGGTSLNNGDYDCVITNGCDTITSSVAALHVSCPNIADVVSLGGGGSCDGQLTADDIVAFLGAFFANQPLADVAGLGGNPTPDGLFTADDIVVFLAAVFAGCP